MINGNAYNIKRYKAYYITFSLIALAAAVIIFFNPPFGETLCPSKRLFGVYCSACGITRAVYCITHLNFACAFNYNQFFTLSLPLYFYLYTGAGLRLFKGVNIFPKIKGFKFYAALYIVLFLAYGIMRNFEILGITAPH